MGGLISIAVIGIASAVVSALLRVSGREEFAMIVPIVGFASALAILLPTLKNIFDTLTQFANLY